ncbi:MAG: alginate O-acetyltransferase [Planctomycetaceae bacterium]|nr:alginate O-acetyltransferase [Planctomycetaceae bacterium]|tara:strand:- start:3500 stop:4948 length:1449 start_codon:yes stop_codon:yes gene_type:complete
MLFNSLTYLLLLTAVFVGYWLLPLRGRLSLIFVASLTFYAFWKIEFLPVMMVSVMIDYWVALAMRDRSPVAKKLLLVLSLAVNLGLLFYFKYLIFFAENAVGIANLVGIQMDPFVLDIILPLGISFYTFQTLSYTIDVYRGVLKPERDFLVYGCFVTFFPQLVAGPILRASEVIPQLVRRPTFSLTGVFIGVRRIIFGLFLKVVLADNIAPLVDAGFSLPTDSLSALDVWTLAFLFGFQIYFDFSAYSSIAIGSARILGIQFPENFNFPYLANSPREFWRRWHISLSSWIRDYLYLPLSGIQVQYKSEGGLMQATNAKQKNFALFMTWAVMGLWHGANWTFVLWGIYLAAIIFAYRLLSPYLSSFGNNFCYFGGILVTLPLMMLSWIPFRAESVSSTLMMCRQIFIPDSYLVLGMRENTYLVAAIVMVGIVATYFVKNTIAPWLEKNHRGILCTAESAIFAVTIPLVLVFLRPISQFIYFQF